jgi:hypothetical protein
MGGKPCFMLILSICFMVTISACTSKEEKIASIKSEVDPLVKAEKYEEAITKYEEILKITDNATYTAELDDIKKKNEEMKIEQAKKEEEAKKAEEEKKKAAEIPEPYKKAMQNFSKGDAELALKYLDLTITDFGETIYNLKANIMKSHILSVKSLAEIHTFNAYVNGVKKLYDSGLEKSDRDKIKKVLDNYSPGMKKTDTKLAESMTYVLQNYGRLKEDVMYNSPITYSSDVTEPVELSYFEKFGYPHPSSDEIAKYEKYYFENKLKLYTKSAFRDNKIKFVDFFYYVAVFSPNELYELKLKEIIKLTEDDKYNEFRIKAEEELKSNKGNK